MNNVQNYDSYEKQEALNKVLKMKYNLLPSECRIVCICLDMFHIFCNIHLYYALPSTLNVPLRTHPPPPIHRDCIRFAVKFFTPHVSQHSPTISPEASTHLSSSSSGAACWQQVRQTVWSNTWRLWYIFSLWSHFTTLIGKLKIFIWGWMSGAEALHSSYDSEQYNLRGDKQTNINLESTTTTTMPHPPPPPTTVINSSTHDIKFQGERKFGRGSQMGAWHQDGLTDWLSVVMWLWLRFWLCKHKFTAHTGTTPQHRKTIQVNHHLQKKGKRGKSYKTTTRASESIDNSH
jgi:hypothetical protein